MRGSGATEVDILRQYVEIKIEEALGRKISDPAEVVPPGREDWRENHNYSEQPMIVWHPQPTFDPDTAQKLDTAFAYNLRRIFSSSPETLVEITPPIWSEAEDGDPGPGGQGWESLRIHLNASPIVVLARAKERDGAAYGEAVRRANERAL